MCFAIFSHMWVWRFGSRAEEGKEELIYPQLWMLKDIVKGKEFCRVLQDSA